MNLSDLKNTVIHELVELAERLEIENASSMRRQDLIFAILQAQTEADGEIMGEGVLETLPDGFGFLRETTRGGLPLPEVPNLRIRKCRAQRGRRRARGDRRELRSANHSLSPRRRSSTSKSRRLSFW